MTAAARYGASPASTDTLRSLVADHRFEEAEAWVRARCRAGPPSAEEWFSIGAIRAKHRGIARQPGDWKGALTAFRAALDVDPHHLRSLCAVASHWLDSMQPVGQWAAEAIDVLERAVAITPDRVESHYRLAVVRQATADHHLAVRHYTRVLELDPQHSGTLLRLRRDSLWPHLPSAVQATWTTTMARLRERASQPALVDGRGATPDALVAVRRCFEERGYVWIRNGLALESLDRMREAVDDGYRRCRELPKPVDGKWDPTLLGLDLEQMRGALLRSGLATWVDALLNSRAPGWPRLDHHYANLQIHDERTEGTDLHVDHPVWSKEAPFLTCWTPLTPCGGSETPAVCMFDDGGRGVVHLAEHWPDGCSTIPRSHAVAHLADLLVTPRFVPGDVLIFGPTTWHCSGGFLPTRGDRRYSMDFRFQAGLALGSVPAESSP